MPTYFELNSSDVSSNYIGLSDFLFIEVKKGHGQGHLKVKMYKMLQNYGFYPKTMFFYINNLIHICSKSVFKQSAVSTEKDKIYFKVIT